MTELERRHAAIEATMARYRDRPFAWGKVDCARVAAFHLKQLGFKILISKAGAYRSAATAQNALRRMGYATLAEMADGIGLTPIAYSRMKLGDIAQVPSDHEIGSLLLYAGSGNCFGFIEGHPGLVTMQPSQILRAWCVI